ncbi:hypothetical protein ACIOJE_08970 [Kitasatospora sp. NPDC087861]|uniref:hypothetical protein n=1 Tax=Kitasatospora sp. NPDC087861 TaxID=3364070 RepID=UPI0037F7F4C2
MRPAARRGGQPLISGRVLRAPGLRSAAAGLFAVNAVAVLLGAGFAARTRRSAG